MNYVMGNFDRNSGNYLHRNTGGLAMIDHGYAFDTDLNHFGIPSYMAHHGTSHKEALHPAAAKWLHGLDEKELEAQLKRHAAPDYVIKPAMQRLQWAKQHHLQNPQENVFNLRQGHPQTGRNE